MSPVRRALIVVLSVVSIVAVVALTTGMPGRGRDNAALSAEAALHQGVVPAVAASPTVPAANGVERTRLGAQWTAVEFLELTERVVAMTPADAGELQRLISTPASAERLAAEVEEKLTAIQARVADGVTIHIAPLAVRSAERNGGWDVAIWYVEVAVYGREIAVEQWRTATYAMRWTDAGWRMDALTSTPGPNPTRPAAVAATPIGSFLNDLAGFDPVGVAS